MDADPNLAVLLADAGDDDRVLVTVAQTSSTAGELRASASDVAEHLVKAGLRPGQPVACLIGNSAASIASIFGIWKAGGVVASVNPRTTARELTALLDDVGAAAVVAAASARHGAARRDRFATARHARDGRAQRIAVDHPIRGGERDGCAR